MAECVQPAPCVAATSCRVNRDLDVALPVEEMIDRRVAVTSGDEDGGRASIVDPLGELAA